MNLKSLSKILGIWEGKQGTGIYHEEWKIINDDVFEGKAYLISGDKILNTEKLSIKKDGDKIFYIADVNHNPAPVYFSLTVYDENKFVFENLQHDFPQRISYLFKEENSLLATAESANGNKKLEFNLKKLFI